MSELTTPKTNSAGLETKSYQGGKSTLCTGCGHDTVTAQIIQAYYSAGVHPFKVAKLSGIGCSSKTTAYFMNMAHGFNSIHGRMAAVATGAKIANRELNIIGVSGDGDTASIGLGGFLHLIRRNLPMVYIVENNGVYGLTKGQFSATADYEVTQKSGEKNPFHSLDLCALAIDAGCGFVARAFSGDGKLLSALIQAAIAHNGTAFIDVISPCIAFANHEGSTKSYDYVKSHKVSLQEFGLISETKAPEIELQEGSSVEIKLTSGQMLTIKKIDSRVHNVKDALAAHALTRESHETGHILTGLYYYNPAQKDLLERLELSPKPLTQLENTDLLPTTAQFKEYLRQFR